MIDQPARNPDCRGHNINIRIAVILTCKCDLASVGRKDRVVFHAWRGCEPRGVAAFARNDPKIARVAKHNVCTANAGLAKELGPVRRRDSQRNEKQSYASVEHRSYLYCAIGWQPPDFLVVVATL